MAFTYQEIGQAFHKYILCISVMAGWIAEMLFMLFFAYSTVHRTEHSGVRSILAYGTGYIMKTCLRQKI